MDAPIDSKGLGQITKDVKDDSRPSSNRTMTSDSYSDAMDYVTSKSTARLMMPSQRFSAHEPSKIIPFMVPVASSGHVKVVAEKPLLGEKTLSQMGFISNEVEDWDQVVQPPKQNLFETLRYMVNHQIKPNVQIRVGSVTFDCHMMVLQCYSDYFMDCSDEVIIQLPDEKVTAGAFNMIYNWMQAEQPLVQREGILNLLTAATFLRIKSLVDQCWVWLDDDVRSREENAFMLYKEARSYNLEDIKQLMLTRISKFFLTLVASTDYLALNVDEVCSLLSSSTVGVNSEIEIFFSMVRWLNHNWEEREQHLLRLIKCVRFTLMPPWFLITMNKPTKTMEIDRVTEDKTVSNIINDCICYVSTQAIYGHLREELMGFFERYDLKVPMQREWIYDKECFHHHRVDCGKTQYVTYNSFLQYLNMIQSMGKQYWQTLSYVRADEPCSGCLCMARSVSAVAISTDEKLLKK